MASLFGDVLSDLCVGIVGGMGLVPGSNLGTRYAIFEAFHGSAPEIGVNSSHHQAAETVGEGLRAVARSQPDGVIEALEGTSPDHFVLAVQWHPERSLDEQPSQAIFGALVEAARRRQKK